MLYQETVEPRTLELLRQLLDLPILAPFALLGGTSLALRWGHRKSEDLDLFSNELFSEDAVLENIEASFGAVTVTLHEKQTLRLFIEDVKVEIIAPKKTYLKPFEQLEGIRLFSAEDAMAFKMNAIERRGSKKDFYDLSKALQYFSLKELIGFYQQKFNTHNIAHLAKSIIYFEDAEHEPDPIIMDNRNWEQVKKEVSQHFKNYLKTLK